jgi:hypothetical protein
MPADKTEFASEKAPCGKLVAGERYLDEDPDHEHCRVTDETFYTCGCQSIRHEYHDGGVSRKLVHHDGTVLADELITES